LLCLTKTKTICLHCKKRNISFLQNIQTRSTITGALPQAPIILPAMQRTSSLLLTSINTISCLSYRNSSTGSSKFIYKERHKSHLTFDMLQVASSDIRVLGHSVDTAWRLLLRSVGKFTEYGATTLLLRHGRFHTS